MARVVLSTIGSLGDLHPMLALAFELRRRGHVAAINTWEGYREKIETLGFEFHPLRPNVSIDDTEVHRKAMDARNGPEFVIRELMMGNIHDTYADLVASLPRADVFMTGEIVYAAASASETTGVKWITTSLAPISMFSSYDPNIYMQSRLMDLAWSLPAFFHDGMKGVMRLVMRPWLDEYRRFRREIGLRDDHDPIVRDKFSPLRHLVMYSSALSRPQPDWPASAIQTGFCFYDESESTTLDPELKTFLKSGDAPIVFTLGSAAVMDAGDFFDESVKAAKLLGRRAILLYGRDQARPAGLNDGIVAFEYAPFSLVFPLAACVVHQAGVGTTGQVLRAGVPHLIMPFSHDQPDNAARCRRAGVAEAINRESYTAERSADILSSILADEKYRTNAVALKRIVDGENGTATACDAIEDVLSK